MTVPKYILPFLTCKRVAKFWGLVQIQPTGCWIWHGTRNAKRYGAIGFNCKIFLAHRIAFALYYCREPGALCVLHSCDNPPCVNPLHLFLGTRTHNHQDMVRKGRIPHGENHRDAKVTDADVLTIRDEYTSGDSLSVLGARYGLDPSTVSRMVNRHTWKHL